MYTKKKQRLYDARLVRETAEDEEERELYANYESEGRRIDEATKGCEGW